MTPEFIIIRGTSWLCISYTGYIGRQSRIKTFFHLELLYQFMKHFYWLWCVLLHSLVDILPDFTLIIILILCRQNLSVTTSQPQINHSADCLLKFLTCQRVFWSYWRVCVLLTELRNMIRISKVGIGLLKAWVLYGILFCLDLLVEPDASLLLCKYWLIIFLLAKYHLLSQILFHCLSYFLGSVFCYLMFDNLWCKLWCSFNF